MAIPVDNFGPSPLYELFGDWVRAGEPTTLFGLPSAAIGLRERPARELSDAVMEEHLNQIKQAQKRVGF